MYSRHRRPELPRRAGGQCGPSRRGMTEQDDAQKVYAAQLGSRSKVRGHVALAGFSMSEIWLSAQLLP